MQCVFPLSGRVQNYSWGGFSYLPELLKTPGNGKPFAELWLGTHPAQPADLEIDGRTIPLTQVIGADPVAMLGKNVADHFGALPFLLKVLDVRQMLSIQVHPNSEQAKEGFAKEEAAGIPRNAPHRNYKDEQHKPELMMALSDFWLLHGFRSPDAMKVIWNIAPEFQVFRDAFAENDYYGLYQMAMTIPQAEVDALLERTKARIAAGAAPQRMDPDFWALRAMETYGFDRGIFSIYFFNLLHLQAGEGIFQGAGLPHAYLEGQNIELMANSDNVLRAGLTEKHIDIPELFRLVQFEPTIPQVIPAQPGPVAVYSGPATEFLLQRHELGAGGLFREAQEGPGILLVLQGALSIECNGVQLERRRGEAAYLVPGSSFAIRSAEGAMWVKAAVPVHKN